MPAMAKRFYKLALGLLLSLLPLFAAAIGDSVQDDWVYPSSPDYSVNMTVGDTYTISWTSDLYLWFDKYCSSCDPNDSMLYLYKNGSFYLIADSVNVTSTYKQKWAIDSDAVSTLNLTSDNTKVHFMFLASIDDYEDTQEQISSPIFWLQADIDSASTSTTTSSPSTTDGAPSGTAVSATGTSTKTTTEATSTSSTNDEERIVSSINGLSLPAKIGIGVGVGVIALALVAGIVFCFLRRRKSPPAAGVMAGRNVITKEHTSTARGLNILPSDPAVHPGSHLGVPSPHSVNNSALPYAHSSDSTTAFTQAQRSMSYADTFPMTEIPPPVHHTEQAEHSSDWNSSRRTSTSTNRKSVSRESLGLALDGIEGWSHRASTGL